MKRLTKTQLEVLERAGKSRSGRVATVSGYITSRKRGAFGGRDCAAAGKLRDMGLLEFVTDATSSRTLCHQYGAVHLIESLWRITDAGRDILAKGDGR